jgi:hypothetical protein
MQHGILNIGGNGRGWTGTFHDVVDAVNHLSNLEDRFQLNLSRFVILGYSA